MAVIYSLNHSFRLAFQSRSRFSLTVTFPWLVENSVQKILDIKTNPQAKITRVKNEGWELVSLKYTLDLPSRGSREFKIESRLERSESIFPVSLSKSDKYPFIRQSRLLSHPQWPTNINELYETAVKSVKGVNNLLEVYHTLYRKVRDLISPEHLESRIGAYKAFKKGRGDCDEMADLYITFCRSLGIPARRVTGYYVDKNRVENHAWAEVPYPITDGIWLPVDPAMLNFGHITAGYIAKKIEATISQVSDITYSWKGKAKVVVTSDFTERRVRIELIE